MANNLLCLVLFAGCNIVIWSGQVVNCIKTDLENRTLPTTDYEQVFSPESSNADDYQNVSISPPTATVINLAVNWQVLNLSDACLEAAQRMHFLNKSHSDCGGVLVDTEKDFWSSSSPGDCKWLLCNGDGRHFRLVVLFMSSDCDKYYFDVYDGFQLSKNGSGVEKGTRHQLCGSRFYSKLMLLPRQIITIEYKMASRDSEMPLAIYQFLKHKPDCVLTSYDENGTIVSPEYPDSYPSWMLCNWKIIAPMGYKILIRTIDFHMQDKLPCPELDGFLQIRDGIYEEYPMIISFDGDNPPPPTFISNSNSVKISSSIKFCHHPSRGFMFGWKFLPSGCNETLRVSSGIISSPNLEKSGFHCNWRIIVNPGNIIRLVFLEFWAGTFAASCDEDFVEITFIDGNDTSKVQYCGTRNSPGAIYATNNEVAITQVMSPRDYRGNAFQLRFNAVCTRSLSGYKGTIESINYPHFLPPHLNCMWTINAWKYGSVFINLTNVDLGIRFGLLQILEPERNTSWEEIGCLIKQSLQGTPTTCLSRGNTVLIELKTSERMFSTGTGFRLEWEVHGCYKSIRSKQGFIQSPRYPFRYPVNDVCEWTIATESGSGIELTIHDWEIENSTDCKFDGLKVFPESPHVSPESILHLCGTSQYPSILTTQRNRIYIQFHSDDSLSFKGFNASFKQITSTKNVTCGDDYEGTTGFIYSPNFPKPYNIYANCRWTITVHHNYLAALKILEMEMESNGCRYDNLTVYHSKVITESPNEVLCGKQVSRNVVSSSNVLTVAFQTDGYEVYKGFKSKFYQACGAKLYRDHGIIQSPDFLSMMNGAGNCSWTIIASSAESRVILLFTDFYWPVADPNCGQHYIQVLDDTGENSFLYKGCCSHVPPVTLGSGNNLTLRTTNADDLAFKAFYFTLTEDCVHILKTTRRHLPMARTMDNFSTEMPNNVACRQTLYATEEDKQRVTVQFQLYQAKVHGNICKTHFVAVHEKDFSQKATNFCQQGIPTNENVSAYFWSVYVILDGINASDGGISTEKNITDLPLSGSTTITAKLIAVCMLLLSVALA